MSDVCEDDVGTVIQVTVMENDVALDISAATVKQLIFRKPGDTIVTKDAEFVTDGSDGKIDYTTVAGDLDQDGTWEIQAYIEMGGGKWSSEIATFTVLPRIE
jgi:hypothetical protein